jgi:hypothetical protein
MSKDPHIHPHMNDSIVVMGFTVDGVKEFLTEAGFVDVDVDVVPEKMFMAFGKRMYRTVFFARGRRPLEGGKGKHEEGAKSEL